ncbi:MAG: hypothetical protein GWO07_09615 [Candidatus Dadabacteria bacterium]|nr:hypothetical protein [Candidatus Dadabacteria bacterium]NIS09004.1 hypothetical protein [Candidatus Dadabacteria bacterium]NIV41047.1 hypothetical protein [Candidatus Dadabacteria bacterium]NIX15607.1 hypothetical protein [Candidatus Dadabacteria bacterium]NIY22348.1 hypothetical protein [Candidatus Dadabacteria bacterium]
MGLEIVELIISIEETFDIAIDNEEASKVVTVNDCYKLILSNLVKIEDKSWNDEQVWDKMKELLVYQLGVKPEDVIPEADFIKDLGAD